MEGKLIYVRTFFLLILLILAVLLNVFVKLSISERLEINYDGSVMVKTEIHILEPGIFIVNITLHEIPEELIVYDEHYTPLAYKIIGNRMFIRTINNTLVNVEYITRALTTKEGPIWTINLTFNKDNIILIFPEKTYTLDVSGGLKSISELENGKLMLTFNPGQVSVDYAFRFETTTFTAPITSPSTINMVSTF